MAVKYRMWKRMMDYEGNAVENHPVELPFTLTLDKFEIENYPGSSMSKDYKSHIQISDGEIHQDIVISMNHILKRQHYRSYQVDYDTKGNSILAVGYDPWGIGCSYVGYGVAVYRPSGDAICTT